ncbi:hypothetical protein [Nocardiopsis sp. CA-288880]|uniref:hypothetical protein n=1 Tax=Nocardiopsis sp. CA-288880 TaxID=3239995 RepID=UPI003D98AEDC
MPPDSDQELGRDRPGSPPAPSGASPARGARDAGAVVGPPAPPGGADTRTGGYARDRVAGARRWLRTTPARVWLLTVVCLVSVAGLFGSATLTLDQAREGLDVVGHEAGPQARTTTTLYLALADMDVQLADVLLMGTEHGLGSGRAEAMRQYEESRSDANEALLQAASLMEDEVRGEGAGGGGERSRSVQELDLQAVLDGMGEYEQLAAQALLHNDEAQAPPGEVDQTALVSYRQATRLMHTELLPKAFNVSLDASAIIRAHHVESESSVELGRVWVGVAGGVALVAMLGLQLYMRARFRRRLNAPVAVATAGTVLLTVGVVLSLVNSGEHQSAAKERGLDAEMALARAGAISTVMQADQSRYLVDPAQADNYQQVYLDRAQQVLFSPADDLDGYYEAIDRVVGASGADGNAPDALGYLGQSAYEALLTGSEGKFADVLDAYRDFQSGDRALRAAAEEGPGSAVAARMEVAHAEDGTFRAYEDALDALAMEHRAEFNEGIERGDDALAPWAWLLPAGTLALFALVLLGVRPRLAEYR